MVSKRLLFSGLFLAAFIFPHALKSQTHLTIESLVLNTYSETADFKLMLQSKDLDWKVAADGKSKTDLILSTASLDTRGNVLGGRRQSLTIMADTQNAAKLAAASVRLSANVKIPVKTDKVRLLIQTPDGREIGVFDVYRKTINAAPKYSPVPNVPLTFPEGNPSPSR
jgi:hypothetical protein